MVTSFQERLKNNIKGFFFEPITQYTIIITFFVSLLVVLQVLFEIWNKSGGVSIEFLAAADKQLVINFVEWFGVLYGFLLPTILVRVWEQFDKIDNIFDGEADAVKILIGDLQLLHIEYKDFSSVVLGALKEYTNNVLDFMEGRKTQDQEVTAGNKILTDIRKHYLRVFHQKADERKESDVLVDELLTQLNSIIDSRGDRISLATQRLFESLKFLAVVTSVVWLVPFYFLYFQNNQTGQYLHLGVFGWLLVIAVTFLVIITLTIIDDLDKPFDGFWRVNKKSWENLILELQVIETEAKKQPPFYKTRTRFFTLRDYSASHGNQEHRKQRRRIHRIQR